MQEVEGQTTEQGHRPQRARSQTAGAFYPNRDRRYEQWQTFAATLDRKATLANARAIDRRETKAESACRLIVTPNDT